MQEDERVVQLLPVKPNPGAIEILEGMLEDAKKGELVGFAGITVRNRGQFEEVFTHNMLCHYPVVSLGYLRVLQMRFEQQIELDPPV